MIETWRDYPENSNYEVSDFGRVRNKTRNAFLGGSVRTDGYTQINIGRQWLLHALVLHVFKGPRPLGLWGLHEDDIRSHNYLSNLYYGNSKQNADDRVRNNRAKGIDAAAAKLTREQVLEVCRRLDLNEKYRTIAEDMGLRRGLVTHINSGSIWGWLTGRSAANIRPPTHSTHGRKLDKIKVLEIARRLKASEPQAAIAADMGVTPQNISDINRGKLWAHVTGFGA
jgi:hypothetical protein